MRGGEQSPSPLPIISSQPTKTNLNRLSPQNKEVLRPLCQEPRELVHQDMLNLIRLLDLDADTDRVDTGLNKDSLVLITGDSEWVQ